jgi:ferrous iron transport protein A
VKEGKSVTAARMHTGQIGVVESIDGGHLLCSRLEALGIRPGKRIRKLSSAFMRGPSVFELGSSRLAIGFGMASRILIKTD